MRERFGPLALEIALTAKGGALEFPVRRGWALGVSMPRFLLPKSNSVETVKDGRFVFDVSLSAPLGIGLIVRYQGWLQPAEAWLEPSLPLQMAPGCGET